MYVWSPTLAILIFREVTQAAHGTTMCSEKPWMSLVEKYGDLQS
jgi:hypothetical protein